LRTWREYLGRGDEEGYPIQYLLRILVKSIRKITITCNHYPGLRVNSFRIMPDFGADDYHRRRIS
jgi:hypothetical protein